MNIPVKFQSVDKSFGVKLEVEIDSLTPKMRTEKTYYEDGYDAGYNHYETKILPEKEAIAKNMGIEEGKQAEYNRFWDLYQSNGTRTYYAYAFAGSGWNNNTFKPRHNIILFPEGATSGGSGAYLFTNSAISTFPENKVLNVYGASSLKQAFGFTKFTALPEINLKDFIGASDYLFANTKGASLLQTLTLKVNNLTKIDNTAFTNCSTLENLTIICEGNGGNDDGKLNCSLNLYHCDALTDESLISIVNALKDRTGTDKLILNVSSSIDSRLDGIYIEGTKLSNIISQKNWELTTEAPK